MNHLDDEHKLSSRAVRLREASARWAEVLDIEPADDDDCESLRRWKSLAEAAVAYSAPSREEFRSLQKIAQLAADLVRCVEYERDVADDGSQTVSQWELVNQLRPMLEALGLMKED